MDLSIINGRVPTTHGLRTQDIGISGEKIAMVAEPGQLPPSQTTIDAQGGILIPGAIDSHFHCRAPGEPEKEDFSSATKAAGNGGVTTLLEMPVATPPAIDGNSLTNRQESAMSEIVVDMGFYASAGTLNDKKIESAANQGAIAFKAFYQHVPAGREADLTGICIPDAGNILRAMQLVAKTSRPMVIHSEDHWVYSQFEKDLRSAGRVDPNAHAESRPTLVEVLAIESMIRLAEATDVHLHLPHVSSAKSVDLIRAAKRRGVKVTAETCPHYLTFTQEDAKNLGPYGKCNPPLKKWEDVEALWAGIADRTIDTIATDHSPTLQAEKERGQENIWKAPPGIAGIDILVPFVMSAALTGKLDTSRAVELVTSGPADIFGLENRKGRLAPGLDADIVVYQPTGKTFVNTQHWFTKAKHGGRIWDGYQLTGAVSKTIVRGTVVVEDGKVVAPQGSGKVIKI